MTPYTYYTREQLLEMYNKLRDSDKHLEYGIVVDVETLGKGPKTVVKNIAGHIFTFDPKDMGKVLNSPDRVPFMNLRLRMIAQVELGRTVDQETIQWWEAPERREANLAIEALPMVDFKEGMKEFNDWLVEAKQSLKARVWYRGQDFDYPIYNSLLEDAGIKYKWIRGDAPRDVRSYIDAKLNSITGYAPKVDDDVILHTALGDCINDIRQMQFAYVYSLGYRQ